jgi:hypothetical protein
MVPDRGIKWEHGAAVRPMPWLPRSCKRRAKRHSSHWATGKAVRGKAPRDRRPAIAVVNRGRVGRGEPMGRGRASAEASDQGLFLRSRRPLCARGEDAAQRSQALGRPCHKPDHLILAAQAQDTGGVAGSASADQTSITLPEMSVSAQAEEEPVFRAGDRPSAAKLTAQIYRTYRP